MRLLKISALIFVLFFLGCSTRGLNTTTHHSKAPAYKTDNSTSQLLYQEYEKWQYTRYKYGGITFSGVDCSGLVQSVYKNTFNLKVPRTTRDQANAGYWIAKDDIQVGDLVLFKTGHNVRHSGIVIEDGKFLHSSTKRGVIITNLDKPYYQRTYWQARRVLR